jgi:long-chain acyl-CoA synthetase
VFTAVPRVWEKFYSGVMIALKEASAAAGGLRLGHRRGHRIADRCGRQPVRVAEGKFALARWLALDNVRKLIGIHRALSGDRRGADLAELVKWYLALGVPMLEVWGMTETCGASTGVPAAHQARLHRPGGRLQRGAARPGHRRDPGARPVFMGYLNLPERPPRPSTPTAGCAPATWARWTRTATSASPTA